LAWRGWKDGDGLGARFRECERFGGYAQGLESDLLQGVGEEPALELDAGLGGAFAILEFIQRGFGAVDEDFVLDDRGVESRDEFEEIGLGFDEVGEEIGILGGQGAELVEECLLRLQLLAERNAWVAVHEGLQAPRGRRDATHMAIAAAWVPRWMLEIQSKAPEVY
jgi:hypothetical protein